MYRYRYGKHWINFRDLSCVGQETGAVTCDNLVNQWRGEGVIMRNVIPNTLKRLSRWLGLVSSRLPSALVARRKFLSKQGRVSSWRCRYLRSQHTTATHQVKQIWFDSLVRWVISMGVFGCGNDIQVENQKNQAHDFSEMLAALTFHKLETICHA